MNELTYLKSIEQLSAEGGACMFEKGLAEALAVKGLVEINPNVVNAGEIATRLTEKGKAMLEPEVESSEIDKNVPIPKSKSGPKSSFPNLDLFEVGDSFHFDNPAKYNSVASQLSRKRSCYPNKEFVCARVGEDDVKGEGFRIWRTA